MKKLICMNVILVLIGLQCAIAQNRHISGKVSSAEDGMGLPGVSVVIKGTTTGASTDIDGAYTLQASPSDVLVFSSVGMLTKEISVGHQTVINVVMETESIGVDEVVVTALGITKEKKSLGYAVQEVGGDAVSTAKDASFISSLSGKVSGVNIKKSGQIGGSVNILIRGSNSFMNNNQALFVVDGVPISNSNTNTYSTQSGGGGYDYGNAASDIDPESIESISVLKGATASALYGSDAANGVILITTKKGSKKKGIGVTISQGVTISKYDKDTFPKYQKEYGAGYGAYYGSTGAFYDEDFDGDGTLDLVVPFGEDASFGGAYDPGLMVYQWNSIYPQLDTYKKKTAWVAPKNGPGSFFQTGVVSTTNLALDGGNEYGTFRLAYTNDDRSGIIENSKIKKDIIDFAASYKLTEKFKVDAKATYTRVSGKGRYGTGYNAGNVMQSFRQWFQTNVDVQDQKKAYLATKENITWNSNSSSNLSPHYFDNPYWVIYENYETDVRNRFFGKFQLSYEINEHLNALARFGIDTYTDLQEERIAVGSLYLPRYRKYERTFEEYNTDFMLNGDKRFSEDVTLRGLLGINIKNKKIRSTRSSTTGGLVVPRLYSLSNSASALEPAYEADIDQIKYGYYAQATIGLWDKWYTEGSFRRDYSSTLPEDDNKYNYWAISSSFIFNELLDLSWLNYAKFRVGYAEVALDAPPLSILSTYSGATAFGSAPMFYIPDTYNNPELKNETTKEFEIGLELNMLNNRVGLDLSYYDKSTTDQIMAAQVSTATGYNNKYVNAGEMTNKGVELALFGSPVKNKDFEWKVNVNWAKNKNKVVSLNDDIKNLLMYNQWSTAINARVGEAYGTITGTDFQYKNGKKVVGSDGKYLRTESTQKVIGNIQPDWNGGVSNNFRYKNFSFGFLIDFQKGGDIVSYDMGFGRATGIYAETAGLNELGNPKRDRVKDGGGILLDGVTKDGQQNTTRAEAHNYQAPYGYYGGSSETDGYLPDKALVYDASYVKLREITVNYQLPKSLISKIGLIDATVGLFGRNLWIIDKNLPYGDPEYTSSSGNLQGIQMATLPSTKEYGFNVKVKF
ncbi:SusC/RagA family TonB-linked outer membrane protein [Marinifilum caeruleilacunae]|uniref:SusC/RagA family TonB-linked outer membrane protein n=1 Tax=Marinifilum caeruleilacunae TaxID=2499076 RepID=A0ABX1WVK4_9BACT|nr:SusC/RagA family TonB-linked outer membrane protein [Marinifilum caeruleilacunae]NOU60036.1 SusC/RagA family TonB-linked outer membrane protein [Marinifilum caeruleilacunae]